MRLTHPRVLPVSLGSLDEEQKIALAPFLASGRPVLNIFLTFARAPKALARFNAWTGYIFSRRNSLDPRSREIVILRVGYLCRSGYEFAQHQTIGLACGLAEAEIAAIKAGADAGWSAPEAALIRMADELVRDFFVSDAVWAELEAHFSEKERMDAVFTAGQYVQVSMFLNAFGVQPEDGVEIDPDLRG